MGGSPQAAAITVRRKINGIMKERKYTISPLDRAGGRSGEIGRIETERDPATGRRVEADFRTGAIILAIRKERYRFKRRVRVSDLLWREGSNAFELEKIEVASRDRYRIYYLDEHSLLRRRWMEDEKR